MLVLIFAAGFILGIYKAFSRKQPNRRRYAH